MVADRIAISPTALTAHAQEVEQLATDITVALDAVRSINLAGGAFGVMCSWMVPPALGTSAILVNHIGQVQSVLQRTSDELVGMADDFRTTEEDITTALSALTKNIDTAPQHGGANMPSGVLE